MARRLLTLADVAERLQIKPPTANALVRSGAIPGFQIGGRGMWRVEDVDLEAYIADQKAAAAARARRLRKD